MIQEPKLSFSPNKQTVNLKTFCYKSGSWITKSWLILYLPLRVGVMACCGYLNGILWIGSNSTLSRLHWTDLIDCQLNTSAVQWRAFPKMNFLFHWEICCHNFPKNFCFEILGMRCLGFFHKTFHTRPAKVSRNFAWQPF